MKLIPLTQGRFAVVDNGDFDAVNRWKWFARKTGRNLWYAVRSTKNPTGTVYMHRQIMGFTNEPVEVDHRDGNGLNNTRNNLRSSTTLENSRGYRSMRLRKTVNYRGVTFKRRKFRARITFNGQELYLGTFPRADLAAIAYDRAAKKYFGDFAQLNFGRY